MVIIDRTRRQLSQVWQKFIIAAETANVKINESKSKFIELGLTEKHHQLKVKEDMIVETGPTSIIRIKKSHKIYIYLEIVITETGDEEKDTEVRLAKGDNCACALNKILRSKSVSR